MEILALIAFFFVGLIAGLIGGLLGLSGGVVTVPSLFFIFHFFDFPQDLLMHLAIGTSLAAMILTGIASTWAHHRHQGVIWKIVFLMSPGILCGCFFGAFLADFLSGIILQLIFGLFVGLLGVSIFIQKKSKKRKRKPKSTGFPFLGFGIGSFASLLGIGGGVFSVPLLLKYQYPERKAIGTSAAIGLLITFFAAVAYLYLGLDAVRVKGSFGYIYLPAFFLVGVGTVIFAPLGAKLAHRIQGKLLRKLFAGTLIIVGILMIFN